MADPKPPVLGTPQYAACFSRVANLKLSDLFKGEPGRQRLDPELLRCFLLVEEQGGIGKRVLDLDNYFDCRVERGIDVSSILNEAFAAGGYPLDRTFLGELLDAIQDAKDAGSTDLGPLESLVAAVGNPDKWPRAGTFGRVGADVTALLSIQLADTIVSLIKKIWPATVPFADDTKKILYLLVDMLFFVGDYFAEAFAIRKEMAVRLLSYNPATDNLHPYGIGRVNTIRGAYAATNPGGASMATVRAWCKAGRDLNKPYLAPDGTDGDYQKNLAAWEAIDRFASVPVNLGITAAEFLAADIIIAGIYGTYSKQAAREIADKIYGAFSGGDLNPVLTELTVFPTIAEDQASTIFVGTTGLGLPGSFVPWWEDTVVGNFNWSKSSSPENTRILFRKRMTDAIKRVFAPVSSDGKRFLKMTSRRDFAEIVSKVWDLWFAFERSKNPYSGSRTIRTAVGIDAIETLPAVMRVFDTITLDPLGTLAKTFTAREALFLAMTGQTTMKPVPVAPTVKGPCPSGGSDCLPCSVIKSRRPIGAKPISIPTVIEWGGRNGPAASSEFAAWKARLAANGYPPYYIDCLAQSVAFVAKPGASYPVGAPGTRTGGTVPGAVPPVVRKPVAAPKLMGW